MKVRFLCTTTTAPPGFDAKQPTRADLLRGVVVLLCAGSAEARALVAGSEQRIHGLVVVVGDEGRTERLGALLWLVMVPPAMVPHLRGLLEGFADAIADADVGREQRVVLDIEVARLRSVLEATRAHYNVVTERLQQHVEQVSQLNASLHDKIERLEQVKAALRASEEDLAITLDGIGDSVIATDGEGRVRRMNPAAEQLTGWARDDAVGRPLAEVVRMVAPERHTVIAELVAPEQRPSRHAVLLTRDGVERIIDHSVTAIRSPDGTRVGAVVVLRDVTEQVRLEQRLRESQRMDALGQLAGGVAHDFNNVLSGIAGYAQLLRRRLVADPAAGRQVDAIARAAERAAGLTTQLLAFARGSQAQVRAVDVHRIVIDAVELAQQTVDRRISIETRLTAEPATIVADPSLVSTVLLNLLVNARDAMPRGGRIVVATALEEMSTITCDDPAGLAAGTYVVVSVGDTGVGIGPDVVDRIFEPFFTTKEPGKGTGLGLAAVYGIMRDHRGGVSVDSQLGAGTTFYLRFPAAGATTGDSSAETELPRRGRGELLVVDDDALARGPLVEALIELGYTVTEAIHGGEAVALVEREPRRFDAVLMDLNMPVMHGRDAVAAIRGRAPRLPVLVLSGYLPDADAVALERLGVSGFVQKPWQLAALSHQLAAALADRDPSR